MAIASILLCGFAEASNDTKLGSDGSSELRPDVADHEADRRMGVIVLAAVVADAAASSAAKAGFGKDISMARADSAVVAAKASANSSLRDVLAATMALACSAWRLSSSLLVLDAAAVRADDGLASST